MFGRAVHSLSKIGEELYIEPLQQGVRYHNWIVILFQHGVNETCLKIVGDENQFCFQNGEVIFIQK